MSTLVGATMLVDQLFELFQEKNRERDMYMSKTTTHGMRSIY